MEGGLSGRAREGIAAVATIGPGLQVLSAVRLLERDLVVRLVGVGADRLVDVVQREASLMMLDDGQVGDYVLIHAGFAIEKIDEVEAQLTLDALRTALDQGLFPE